MVFHAGTKLLPDGTIVTDGGRAVDVVGFGHGVPEARWCAYNGVYQITWEDETHRKDIGKDVR